MWTDLVKELKSRWMGTGIFTSYVNFKVSKAGPANSTEGHKTYLIKDC